MAKIRLEEIGNFLKVTDLQTNVETRFLSKDTYYSYEDNNKVVVITWDKNNGEVTHKYKVSELVDGANAPFNIVYLDSFLSQTLGFNGGGTSPTPLGYTTFKFLITYNGSTPQISVLEDTLSQYNPFLNIYLDNTFLGNVYTFDGGVPGTFPIDKTFVTVGNIVSSSYGLLSGAHENLDSKINLMLVSHGSGQSEAAAFNATPIEITVYD